MEPREAICLLAVVAVVEFLALLYLLHCCARCSPKPIGPTVAEIPTVAKLPTVAGLMDALQMEALKVQLSGFSIGYETWGGTGVYYRAKFGQSQTTAGAYVLFELPLEGSGRIHVKEVMGRRAVKGNSELLMFVLIQAARNAHFTLLTANPATTQGKGLARKLGITQSVPGEDMLRGLTL